jgi:hypothetical protein
MRLVPLTEATQLPKIVSPADFVSRIRSGLQMPPELLAIPPEHYERFQLLDPDRQLIAVAHVEDNRVIYDRVFGVDASRTFPQSAP